MKNRRSRLKLLVLSLYFMLVVMLLPGISTTCCTCVNAEDLAASAWPYKGHDSWHTGQSPYIGTQTNALNWAYHWEGDKANQSSPAIESDGTIYEVSRYRLYSFGEDTIPPEIICSDITVPASGILTKVICTVQIVDSADPFPIVNYDPGQSYEFPIGTTEVKVTASDASGNTNTRTFKVTVIEGQGELTDNAWPCEKHDARNSGLSPYIGAQTNNLKWSVQTWEKVSSPVIGADGTIFFVNSWDITGNGGRIYAFNADGHMRWNQPTDMSLSPPVIGTWGVIYVGGWAGSLFAFTPEGKTVEDSNYPAISDIFGEYYPPPTIGIDGTFYVGSPGRVTAFNPDGSLKWIYPSNEDIDFDYGWYSKPAIGHGGTIYSTQYENIHAISPNGALIWIYQTEENGLTMPVIGDDGTIYVGGSSGEVYAIDPDNILKWSYQTGGTIQDYLSPSIGAERTIYIPCDDRRICAIDPVGSLKWCYTAEDMISTSLAIGGDSTVYFGSEGGKVYALDLNGTLKWSYQTEGKIDSTPAIGADGTVYVGSYDGKIYAFGPNDANAFSLESRFNNVVVFGDSLSDNGNYYFYSGGIKPDDKYFFNGRYSNGQVWVEYLASAIHPDCNLINNAYGGAMTDGFFPFGLKSQVSTFLTTNILPEKALFVIWIGANDLLTEFIEYKTSAGNIGEALNMLAQAGAQDILILNLPNLGAVPYIKISYEDSVRFKQLTMLFNEGLKKVMNDFNKKYSQINLYFFDIFYYFEDLVKNPEKYGLSNSTNICPNYLIANNFENDGGYLFWDEIHPTTQVHKLIAAKASEILNSLKTYDASTTTVSTLDTKSGTDKGGGGCFITTLYP